MTTKEFIDVFSKKYKNISNDLSITLIEKNDKEINIFDVISYNPKKGLMTKAFKLLIKMADNYSIDLTLTSYPIRHDIDEIEDFSESSRLNELNNKYLNNEELENFYKKFGFIRKENETSETPYMIRISNAKRKNKLKKSFKF